MGVRGFTHVFRNPSYIVLALVVACLVLVIAVWFPNLNLIIGVLGTSGVSLEDKIAVLISLLGSLGTNFSLLSASYTVAIAILFGMNVALLVFLGRRRLGEVQQGGVATGFLGLISGMLGIGCAACGTFLASGLFAFFGGSGALLLLPLGGSEFGILGVVLLLLSVILTARQIGSPAVCAVT